MEAAASCPACGQPTTLLALGARWDRLHRWRPWALTCTQLYLCACCDALLAVRRTRHGAERVVQGSRTHGRGEATTPTSRSACLIPERDICAAEAPTCNRVRSSVYDHAVR